MGRSPTFDFLGLKNLSPGNSNSRSYWILKLLVVNWKSEFWKQTCVTFLLFSFSKESWRFKVKESMHFVEQKYKLIKTKRDWKWKIPHTVLERRTLCFMSYKNRKPKAKLWWAGSRERIKRAYFVPFILSEGNFFNICVLSQCIEYTQYIYIYIHSINLHSVYWSSNSFTKYLAKWKVWCSRKKRY